MQDNATARIRDAGGDSVCVSAPAAPTSSAPPRLRHRRARGILLYGLITLLCLIAAFRGLLPWAVRGYINRTLDRNPLYSGSIGKVGIHLLRCAYSIEDIRISRTVGNAPVPFVTVDRIEFAMEWKALLHRRLVGRIQLDRPALNFVDAPDDAGRQSGGGGRWLQTLGDLFPFQINSATVHDGSLHFRTYQTARPIDVYLSHLEATLADLGNIRNTTDPLVATFAATAMAMDQAKCELKMRIDPFAYQPTFHLVLRLLNLDVTTVNDLALAYGQFDFKRGWFDLVIEADAKEGRISGYVKPLFRELQVFDLREDFRTKGPLHFLWQALLGAVSRVFRNPARNQFGTLMAFDGDVDQGTRPDILATAGNTLRNAFIRAYLPRLERGGESGGFLTFHPTDLADPISISDPP